MTNMLRDERRTDAGFELAVAVALIVNHIIIIMMMIYCIIGQHEV